MDYEKLGVFYLGKRIEPASQQVTDEPILYDSKDLTTHGMCVGMTGSGKTGLCLSLIEEAAIDGIPVLAIDPKGDLGNLMLTFPDLLASDFAPWIDTDEAARKGRTNEQHAEAVSKQWREGLAAWQQDGARIRRLRDAADFAIYTPGSQAGLPLSILKGFAAPSAALLEDREGFTARVQATTSSLLSLLGIDTDPLRSREHMLVANLLEHFWQKGKDLEIADLIRAVQEPPFQRIGVMDLESMFPGKDRFGLAMAMNGLLASPAFAAWAEGEPLDVQRLLWTRDGKPRVSIISIAHLPDDQRMFFVTLLLSEVLAWMRQQSGTSSLRALLYMDEVFGFLPPTANPPSKLPMMTLLKQARAFGVGVMLATQNPVDLDYKALSNMGTWFLGRLQTERDKLRVLDGLEGVSAQAGAKFDRAAVDKILSGMQGRTFLLHNVHDDGPVLLHTRWAMSYLRGPLTRTQIQAIMRERKASATEPVAGPGTVRAGVAAAAAASAGGKSAATARPVLQDGITQRCQAMRRAPSADEALVYRPALLGTGMLHYQSTKDDLDLWRKVWVIAPLQAQMDTNPWDDDGVVTTEQGLDFDEQPDERGSFSELPTGTSQAKAYASWAKQLKDELYRSQTLKVQWCPALKQGSQPGESEGDFRARLALAVREQRDLAKVKLQQSYQPKIQRLQERRRNAEQVVEQQKAQRSGAGLSAVLNIGTSILGALFGRKKVTTSVTSAIKGASRVGSELGDVRRAQEDAAALLQQEQELDREFTEEVARMELQFEPATIALESNEIVARKSDIKVEDVVLLWTPWAKGKRGETPLAG
ncbi:MAG: ATP-binding protein [Planctomycetota bacterium]